MGFFDFVGDQISSGFKQITGQRDGILGSAMENFIPGGSAIRDVAGGAAKLIGGGGGGGNDRSGGRALGPGLSPVSRVGNSYGQSPGITTTSNSGPSWLERRLGDLSVLRDGVEIGEDIYEDITGKDDDRGRDRGDSENYNNEAWAGAAGAGGLFANPLVQIGGGVLATFITAKALDL